MSLDVVGAAFSYPGSIRALADIGLTVEPGTRLAIVGANGSGKTTLLLVAAAALRPDQGEVRLDGDRLGRDRAGLRAWRRSVGLVLQDPDDQLFAPTVADDVAFGPLNLDLDEAEVEARVAAALAELRIAELRDRPIHMLSLGQKKRVAIAGVLAMQPRFLLCDEPTAGLDPLAVVHLLARLDRLAEEGIAVVVSTHDVDVAYRWADRIVVLDAGRILAAGAPEAVFGDADVVRAARLRMPLLLEIARVLQTKGILPPGPLPRRRRALLAGLAAAGPDRGSEPLS